MGFGHIIIIIKHAKNTIMTVISVFDFLFDSSKKKTRIYTRHLKIWLYGFTDSLSIYRYHAQLFSL